MAAGHFELADALAGFLAEMNGHGPEGVLDRVAPVGAKVARLHSVVFDLLWRAMGASQFGQNFASSLAHGRATSGDGQGVAAGLDREDLL